MGFLLRPLSPTRAPGSCYPSYQASSIRQYSCGGTRTDCDVFLFIKRKEIDTFTYSIQCMEYALVSILVCYRDIIHLVV